MTDVSENIQPDEEAELVSRIIANEEPIFEKFYFRYSPIIFDYFVRLVGRRNIIEDLVQEVFFRFWQHRGRLQPGLELKRYLLGIAKNVFRETLKRRKRDRITYVGNPRILEELLAQKRRNAHKEPNQSSIAEIIEQAKAKLSPDQKEALKLVHDKSLSIANAAKQAGCTYNQMHWRIHQARKEIEKLL